MNDKTERAEDLVTENKNSFLKQNKLMTTCTRYDPVRLFTSVVASNDKVSHSHTACKVEFQNEVNVGMKAKIFCVRFMNITENKRLRV